MEGRMEGRMEGQEKGLWIGKIQTLQEFLDMQVGSRESLEIMTLGELEALQQELLRDYETRFKRP